jgi:hypothetical protein
MWINAISKYFTFVTHVLIFKFVKGIYLVGVSLQIKGLSTILPVNPMCISSKWPEDNPLTIAQGSVPECIYPD